MFLYDKNVVCNIVILLFSSVRPILFLLCHKMLVRCNENIPD